LRSLIRAACYFILQKGLTSKAILTGQSRGLGVAIGAERLSRNLPVLGLSRPEQSLSGKRQLCSASALKFQEEVDSDGGNASEALCLASTIFVACNGLCENFMNVSCRERREYRFRVTGAGPSTNDLAAHRLLFGPDFHFFY
jgi:hypothetical protein